MTRKELDAALALANAATPGPWENVILAHHKTGEMLSGKSLIEYIERAVAYGPWREFHAILCEKVDGRYEVAHVGNGPTSPRNGDFIAAARDLVPALVAEVLRWRQMWAEEQEVWHECQHANPTDMAACAHGTCKLAAAILAETEVTE